MYLPHIKNLEKATRQTINVFGGYNHTPVIGENEFYHMENMTSDTYPALSARGQRQYLSGGGYTPADVFFCGDVMAELLPPRVVLNGALPAYDLGLRSDVRHSVVMQGAYLLIFPEGVYINTVDPRERGEIAEKRYMDGPCKVEAMLVDGKFFHKIVTIPCDKFGEPIDDDVYLEGEVQYTKIINQLYLIAESVPAYRELARAWVKGLKKNDFVELSGFPESMAAANGKHVLVQVDETRSAIVIKKFIGRHEYELCEFQYIREDLVISQHVSPLPSVSLIVPPLDYVISCENRLWGCRYGEAHDGEFVNEIYATELGDFRRWYFQADNSQADNAWAASIGHVGPFTGAVSYGGRPYFFKQDRIYSMYGSDATTFGYTEIPERGVQAGCDRSLCVLDGVMYYKSLDGIVAFDGSSTSLISSALGSVRYKDAVGGGVDGKYYISMTEMGTGKPSLFAYDTRYGLWHREDGFAPVRMATDFTGHLWGLAADGVLTFIGGDPTDLRGVKEGRVPWMVETGIRGLDDPDKKYVSRISLRLSLDVGAYIKMSIQYDSVGDFEQVLFYEGVNLQTLTLPVIPRRCDHMRIRLEGIGNVRIYSITKTIEGGSDQ